MPTRDWTDLVQSHSGAYIQAIASVLVSIETAHIITKRPQRVRLSSPPFATVRAFSLPENAQPHKAPIPTTDIRQGPDRRRWGTRPRWLEDGSYNLTYKHTEGPNKGDTGEQHSTYEYDGQTIIFHWSQSPTNCAKAKVKIVKDGSLEFSNIVECPEDETGIALDQVGMRHWKKIK